MSSFNKADLNSEQAQKIEEIADAAGARVIGKIPFDRAVEDALRRGITVAEHGKGPAAKAIRTLWDVVKEDILAEPVSGKALCSPGD